MHAESQMIVSDGAKKQLKLAVWSSYVAARSH